MEEEEAAESEIKIEPKQAQSAAAAAPPNATLADPSISDAFLTPGSTHCETQPLSGLATLPKAGPPSPGLVQPKFNTNSYSKKVVGAPVWPVVVARLDDQKDAAAEQIKEERHPAVKSEATVAAVETGSTEKKKKKTTVKALVESTPRRSGRERKAVKRYKS